MPTKEHTERIQELREELDETRQDYLQHGFADTDEDVLMEFVYRTTDPESTFAETWSFEQADGVIRILEYYSRKF